MVVISLPTFGILSSLVGRGGNNEVIMAEGAVEKKEKGENCRLGKEKKQRGRLIFI
jgi:hypothetical protein